MIFGSINFNVGASFSEDLTNKISELLSWDSCIKYEISIERFYGVYLHDKRLPPLKDDSTFYFCDDDIIVLIDGYIYNRHYLIERLAITDSTISDPELINIAFRINGESFVNDLNGDFALCIYSRASNRVFLFRDHLGIRPISFCRLGSSIYFSTDILGLCKAFYSQNKIDKNFLINLFMGVSYDYTVLPNKNVIKILPGHYLFADSSHYFLNKYWDPSEIKMDKKLSLHDVIGNLENLVNDSIKIRSDHRFTASAHMSGGLDSGVVSVLSRNEYRDQPEFYGFSWSPDFPVNQEEIEFDERSMVAGICSSSNIISVHSNFDVEDYIAFMSEWKNTSELVFEKKIVEAAQTLHVNLIFSGWGGDEFISTGNRGIDNDLIKKFNWIYFLRKHSILYPKRLLSAIIFNVALPTWRRSFLRYKTDPFIFNFIQKGLFNNNIPKNERWLYKSRRSIHLKSLEDYHLSIRTDDWYILGQRNGIEYRYPLLDKRIIEYMMKVPSKCLVDGNNTRIILRNIGKKILPENVISNNSKNDPVKSSHLKKVSRDATKILVNELNEFIANKDLDFVNFDLLKKAIKEYHNQEINDDIALIMFNIKMAHEFTRAYYN